MQMLLRFKNTLQIVAFLAVATVSGLSSALAQQKQFLLFFDFEKTEIGASGMKIVETVAESIKSTGKAGTIALIGHTDTAEVSGLSLVRALETAKALVATGALPADTEISITGVGATKPLVQTGLNVHEPQNRFVSILVGEVKAPPPAPPPQAAVTPPPNTENSVIAGLPGDYSCNGSNPNGSTYRCNVTISRSGDVYSFRWLISDGTRYSGRGRLNGRILTVNWGQSAPVIYRVGDDGVLRGTWARGEGRETLTPNR